MFSAVSERECLQQLVEDIKRNLLLCRGKMCKSSRYFIRRIILYLLIPENQGIAGDVQGLADRCQRLDRNTYAGA